MIKLPVMMLSMASANADEPQLLRRRLDADRLMADADQKEIPKDPAICKLSKEKGKLPKKKGQPGATEATTRWFFNQSSGQCETMKYKGSGGNENNFETQKECEELCEDLCDWEAENAECNEVNEITKTYCNGATLEKRWFFNKFGSCQEYRYQNKDEKKHGPWEKDANSFRSQEKCEERCQKQPKHVKALLVDQYYRFLLCKTKECEIENSTFSEDDKQILYRDFQDVYNFVLNRMFVVEKNHDTCALVAKRASQQYVPAETLSEDENEQTEEKLQQTMLDFFKCTEKSCGEKRHEQFKTIVENDANINEAFISNVKTFFASPALQDSGKKSASSEVYQNAMLYSCKMKLMEKELSKSAKASNAHKKN